MTIMSLYIRFWNIYFHKSSMSTGVSMVADVLHVRSSMSPGVSTVAEALHVRFNATISRIILIGKLHAA